MSGTLIREQLVDAFDFLSERSEAPAALRACAIEKAQKGDALELVVDPQCVVKIETHGADAPWVRMSHRGYLGPGPFTIRTH
jgi:hypothetical protein